MKNDQAQTMGLGLRTCIYLVDDLEKAKVWYSRAFATKPYFDQPFYVGFNIGGYELGLQPTEEKTSHKPPSVLCYWGVENIEAAYQHFLDLGALVHEAPQGVGGELKVASVIDPFDNVIGLIYNPDFKVDA